jgi:hypothetical protein
LPFVPMGGIVMYKVGDLLDFLSTRVEPDTNDA